MAKKKELTKLEQESYEWYKNVLAKIAGKKYSTEYTKMNRRAIKPGSMVAFKYPNPKTPLKILRWFDANPLVFIFNIRGNYIHGINLHWAPRKFREIIVKYIIKINKMNIKKNRRLELSWEMIKDFLRKNGLAHIITKTYITPRIAGLEYIKPKDWYKAIHVPSEKFVLRGDLSEDDLYRFIYSHTKKTKSGKNKTGKKKK